MLFIEEDTIKQILVELSDILSDQYIVTGSCADMFNIGYKEVEDFDLVIEETVYHALHQKHKSSLKQRHTLKHKKDGHILKRCTYKNYKVDLMIKKKELIDKDITKVDIDNHKIMIFGNHARYNQLQTYNYRNTSPVAHKKYPKVFYRIEQYKILLNM